jgi:hypothetical protein
MRTVIFVLATLILAANSAATPPELQVGRAKHAFDHLGDIGNQAEAAAASGATILYTSGLGQAGYQGLPPESEFEKLQRTVRDYNQRAKQGGIERAIGYVCATSIVKLATFDKNWGNAFRRQFKTSPSEWRQQDRQGNALASWYGGDYAPACMNNPDWRRYEKAIVRYQLETGHDGIFFDNPTVHPQGCYCPYCMERFEAHLKAAGVLAPNVTDSSPKDQLETLRALADSHPREFQTCRAETAREFLTELRTYARSINPQALITCNNSLNSPDVLYSQCRTYGYNIFEMSKVEDFVVVEDMANQPRVDASGQTFEYGPTYKQLQAICHDKPIVAVTIAGGDYHTPPNLVRLAMAEAAANDALYMLWPTWPKAERTRMISDIRPQADFLRENASLLNDATQRSDLILFLPFRRWLETEHCAASDLAAILTKANVQFRVIDEEHFVQALESGQTKALVIESNTVLTTQERDAVTKFDENGGRVVAADSANWLESVASAVGKPSVRIDGSPLVRAVVRDQQAQTIVHVFNLDIRRLSSYQDKVTSVRDLKLEVRVPFDRVDRIIIRTAGETATSRPVEFASEKDKGGVFVKFTIPRLEISSLVEIHRGS